MRLVENDPEPADLLQGVRALLPPVPRRQLRRYRAVRGDDEVAVGQEVDVLDAVLPVVDLVAYGVGLHVLLDLLFPIRHRTQGTDQKSSFAVPDQWRARQELRRRQVAVSAQA